MAVYLNYLTATTRLSPQQKDEVRSAFSEEKESECPPVRDLGGTSQRSSLEVSVQSGLNRRD